MVEGVIDSSDPAHSNWMKFINCARSGEEQNMMAFQYRGEIYYRTFKDVHPGAELLVWYGDQYANDLGLSKLIEGKLLVIQWNLPVMVAVLAGHLYTL